MGLIQDSFHFSFSNSSPQDLGVQPSRLYLSHPPVEISNFSPSSTLPTQRPL